VVICAASPIAEDRSTPTNIVAYNTNYRSTLKPSSLIDPNMALHRCFTEVHRPRHYRTLLAHPNPATSTLTLIEIASSYIGPDIVAHPAIPQQLLPVN
jgi:hypothetical protein